MSSVFGHHSGVRAMPCHARSPPGGDITRAESWKNPGDVFVRHVMPPSALRSHDAQCFIKSSNVHLLRTMLPQAHRHPVPHSILSFGKNLPARPWTMREGGRGMPALMPSSAEPSGLHRVGENYSNRASAGLGELPI